MMFQVGKRITLMILAFFLAIVLLACQTTTTTTKADFELAGEYEIDITNLGMPLVFYLKMETDSTFKLSSNRNYDVDKGHGTVAGSGGTYMLLYSDSTTENPKTATFTVVNQNLLFSTNLPYGASNINFMKVDDDDPEITYYLMAKIYAFEDRLGEYAGSHTVSAMGSEITYQYSIHLKPGLEYTFRSDFEMGGEAYSYDEKGIFTISGMTITITPEGQSAIEGVIKEDGSLDLSVKPSQMGSRAVRNLRLTTTAAYAGVYLGYRNRVMGETVMYDTDTTLILDKFGGYTYQGIDAQSGTIDEVGTYSVSGTTITFTVTETQATHTGTIQNFMVVASFVVSTQSTNRAEIVSYRSNVQGELTGTTTVEEVEYTATLMLNPDGTYTLELKNAENAVILTESGTFTITKTMLVNLNLTAGAVTRNFVVSMSGVNGNIVHNEVTYGFLFAK